MATCVLYSCFPRISKFSVGVTMAKAEPSSFKDEKRWSLNGMTALVTGGSRGMGHAIAEELAEFGAAVHICSRNQADIDKCIGEWQSRGLNVTGSSCDVFFPEQRKRLMETVASNFEGKLNILVNNAGMNIPKEATTYNAEEMSTIMGTNFDSAYHLCQLAYPLFKASGYGSIVNISSMTTVVALPLVSIYAASKGAMNMMTKSLASEWGKDNIRANAIAPGPIQTALLELYSEDPEARKSVDHIVSHSPVNRIGQPKDVSAMAVFLCLPAASYITGQLFRIDGGFTENGYTPQSPN